jgi:hypothetical protein
MSHLVPIFSLSLTPSSGAALRPRPRPRPSRIHAHRIGAPAALRSQSLHLPACKARRRCGCRERQEDELVARLQKSTKMGDEIIERI